VRAARHAVRDWIALERLIRARRRLLLLTDFDGTLTPIRPTPAQARLDPSARAALRRLSRRAGIRVGLVSGRSIAELRRRVRIPGIVYVGNHGLEIEGPSARFVHPAARRRAASLARLARQLCAGLRRVRGVVVEAKGLSLSVHWRLVPAAQTRRFRARLRVALAPWAARRRVRVTYGKRVVEIRPPVAWDKGSAVEWLMGRYGYRHGEVLYLGDDRTDEDALRAAGRRGGLTVFVGARPSAAARWWVRDPQEAVRLLRRIEAARG
jgi:trehalose-phosphatase